MRLAICDDNQGEASEIRRLLAQYAIARPGLDIEAICFSRGQALLDAVAAHAEFHLILLDIVMPELSGLQVATRLSELRHPAPVVFLTSSRDYAVEAFAARARHYLLKPIVSASFFTMLDEQLATLSTEQSSPLHIAAENGNLVVTPIGNVVYAECTLHKIAYHLTDGQQVVSRTMRIPFSDAVKPLLDSGRFLQPHRSYVVNTTQVMRMSDRALTLMSGVEIPVSQLRRTEVKRAYMDYLSS